MIQFPFRVRERSQLTKQAALPDSNPQDEHRLIPLPIGGAVRASATDMRRAAPVGGLPPLGTALTVLELPSIELFVTPFTSFREVGRFHQLLLNLPGVRDVHLRRLQRGTLQLRVECRSSAELLDGLASAYHASFRVVAREPHRIELALQESDELADLAEGRRA